MVTQTFEEEVVTQEVDPALPDTQTEIEEAIPDAAEEPVEAAAVESEPPLTRAEFEKLMSERESAIRASAIEEARDLDRRQRQSEEGRRAFEVQRQAKLRDAVSVSLTRKLGITDVDDDTADDIISRVQGVEADVIEQGTAAAIDEAVTAAAARAVGLNPGPISAEAQRYVGKFTGYMERLFTHQVVRDFIAKDAKKEWDAQLPKVVEAELSKRNQAGRNGAAPLKRPTDSSPTSGNDGSLENWDTRVAHQGEDGYPMLSPSDWTEYRAVRRASGV